MLKNPTKAISPGAPNATATQPAAKSSGTPPAAIINQRTRSRVSASPRRNLTTKLDAAATSTPRNTPNKAISVPIRGSGGTEIGGVPGTGPPPAVKFEGSSDMLADSNTAVIGAIQATTRQRSPGNRPSGNTRTSARKPRNRQGQMVLVSTKLNHGWDAVSTTPHRSSVNTAAGAAATQDKAPPTGLDGTRAATTHPVTTAGNNSAVSSPRSANEGTRDGPSTAVTDPTAARTKSTGPDHDQQLNLQVRVTDPSCRVQGFAAPVPSLTEAR